MNSPASSTRNTPQPPASAGGGAGNGAAPAQATGGVVAAVRRLVPSLEIGMPARLSAWLRPRLPDVALLFSRDHLTLVRVTAGEKGGRPVLTHLISRELPAGSVVPRPERPAVTAPTEVAAELGRVLDQLPDRAKLRRVSVIIPDSSALVTLLTVSDLPRAHRQASEVIRWQIRKRVPFRVADARVKFQRFALGGNSERVLVAVVLESIVGQFEQLVESLGVQPGLVDISTLNLGNLLGSSVNSSDPADGDVAVLNVTRERLSFMILREHVPLFYRCKTLLHRGATDDAAIGVEVQRELSSSVTYYRERLAGKTGRLSRAFLRSALGGDGSLEAAIAESLGVRPRPFDLTASLHMAELPAPEDVRRAAPALGVLLGRRSA